jgi:PAS domain S-box-containing protein
MRSTESSVELVARAPRTVPHNKKKLAMLSQRAILGAGLAVLLIVSAASFGLDMKSRSDATWVNHTLEVINKLSEARLLMRRAESAARGYVISGIPSFLDDYHDVRGKVDAAFTDLKAAASDNDAQLRLLDEAEKTAARRLAAMDKFVGFKTANDAAGIASIIAGGEGRNLMEVVNSDFDRLAAVEDELLAVRGADSRRTGALLLAANLVGVALILILVAILVRASRTRHRELEATVASQSEHLVSAHEEVRLSTAVLRSTFDSMAEAVLVISPEGEIVLSNPAAEKMLRFQRGMNVEDLRELSTVYKSDGTTLLRRDEMPAQRVLRGEAFTEQEIIVRPRSGRPPVHLVISGQPLRGSSGTISGAALVYHDITGARETENKLQQAQKLEAIGKLTGGVAHDFNNMLTVITGTTEALVARVQDQPDLVAVARLIDDAANRCAELVKQLLAFARKQPLQPRNVNINERVMETAKLLRPTLGEQIEIETILGDELPMAHIDPSQLANAVINMAINARDAMPNGGKLLLETRNVVLDEAYGHSNPDTQPGAYVMLAITDTGTGMPKAVQERAFEPFFTTKEVGKGSGLGLSMVYGFVKQSGGHIKIYSEEGHGTSIKLYLPPARGAAAAATATTVPASGGDEIILVVEDDAFVRTFVDTQLKSLGYKTLVAANGREALGLVDRGEPFDLLFTDVIMPGGMSGRELAEAVRKLRPGIRVLYTSGYTDNSIVHHGRLDEGVLLLTKPYRRPQLAQMIRQALTEARITQ